MYFASANLKPGYGPGCDDFKRLREMIKSQVQRIHLKLCPELVNIKRTIVYCCNCFYSNEHHSYFTWNPPELLRNNCAFCVDHHSNQI